MHSRSWLCSPRSSYQSSFFGRARRKESDLAGSVSATRRFSVPGCRSITGFPCGLGELIYFAWILRLRLSCRVIECTPSGHDATQVRIAAKCIRRGLESQNKIFHKDFIKDFIKVLPAPFRAGVSRG